MDIQFDHQYQLIQDEHDYQVNEVNLKQSQNLNKLSVSTTCQSNIPPQIVIKIEPQKHFQQQIKIKKTQLIEKNRQKKVLVPKNKKILQTLRNITLNIKNQLKSSNQSKNTNIIMPQIQAKAQDLKIVLKIAQQIISPQQSPQKAIVPQRLTLYQNGLSKQFRVFSNKHLSDKKQLRNMTIQRVMDNDVDSDDQQIQLSMTYMYYQLVNSCNKKDSSRINSKSQKKQHDNIQKEHKSMYKQPVKRKEDNVDRVKQKLVFN